jgi:hypothetical protein
LLKIRDCPGDSGTVGAYALSPSPPVVTGASEGIGRGYALEVGILIKCSITSTLYL